MKILLDYTLDELKGSMLSLGEQKFRAEQLFNALQLAISLADGRRVRLPFAFLFSLSDMCRTSAFQRKNLK